MEEKRKHFLYENGHSILGTVKIKFDLYCLTPFAKTGCRGAPVKAALGTSDKEQEGRLKFAESFTTL